jgi:hypothetical protein
MNPRICRLHSAILSPVQMALYIQFYGMEKRLGKIKDQSGHNQKFRGFV